MKLTRQLKTDQQKQNAARFIESMHLGEGKVLTIQDIEDVRTLEQNNFLWSQVYAPIAEQVGEATGAILTKDDVHEFLKDRFGPRVIRRIPGCYDGEGGQVTKSYPKSTTRYTKSEMSDYLEQCFAWGAENGVWFS